MKLGFQVHFSPVLLEYHLKNPSCVEINIKKKTLVTGLFFGPLASTIFGLFPLSSFSYFFHYHREALMVETANVFWSTHITNIKFWLQLSPSIYVWKCKMWKLSNCVGFVFSQYSGWYITIGAILENIRKKTQELH